MKFYKDKVDIEKKIRKKVDEFILDSKSQSRNDSSPRYMLGGKQILHSKQFAEKNNKYLQKQQYFRSANNTPRNSYRNRPVITKVDLEFPIKMNPKHKNLNSSAIELNPVLSGAKTVRHKTFDKANLFNISNFHWNGLNSNEQNDGFQLSGISLAMRDVDIPDTNKNDFKVSYDKHKSNIDQIPWEDHSPVGLTINACNEKTKRIEVGSQTTRPTFYQSEMKDRYAKNYEFEQNHNLLKSELLEQNEMFQTTIENNNSIKNLDDSCFTNLIHDPNTNIGNCLDKKNFPEKLNVMKKNQSKKLDLQNKSNQNSNKSKGNPLEKIKDVSPKFLINNKKKGRQNNFIAKMEENNAAVNYLFDTKINEMNKADLSNDSKNFSSRSKDTDLNQLGNIKKLYPTICNKAKYFLAGEYEKNVKEFVRERFITTNVKEFVREKLTNINIMPNTKIKGINEKKNLENSDYYINKIDNSLKDDVHTYDKRRYIKRTINGCAAQNTISSFNLRLEKGRDPNYDKEKLIYSARNNRTPDKNFRSCFKTGSNFKNHSIKTDLATQQNAKNVQDNKFKGDKIQGFLLTNSKLHDKKLDEPRIVQNKFIYPSNFAKPQLLYNESCPPDLNQGLNRGKASYNSKLRRAIQDKHAVMDYKNEGKNLEIGVLGKIKGQIDEVKDRYVDIELAQFK